MEKGFLKEIGAALEIHPLIFARNSERAARQIFEGKMGGAFLMCGNCLDVEHAQVPTFHLISAAF